MSYDSFKQNNVFITGGTGFVGQNLILELVKQDHIRTIYMLNRNQNNKEFVSHELKVKKHEFKEKIININGDLGKTRLGLSKEDYDIVRHNTDTIYHIGAHVNHSHGYKTLAAENVKSISEIIELAMSGKKKIINFASTIRACSEKNSSGKYLEKFPEQKTIVDSMGYIQSKHEAELLLSQSSEIKNISNIFRLGYIVGEGNTDGFNFTRNHFMLFLKSCIQIGFAPDIDRSINAIFINYVVNYMSLPLFRHSGHNVMNMTQTTDKIELKELYSILNKMGFLIKIIDYPSWQKILIKNRRGNALHPLILQYRKTDSEHSILKFSKNINSYINENFLRIMHKNNLIFQNSQKYYFTRLFEHLKTANFFYSKPKMEKCDDF